MSLRTPETARPVYPVSQIGEGLAFAEVAAELSRAIAEPGSSAVVQAPPGSGKTTLVPPIVANATPGAKVIVTQPRRVAARAGAARLRELLSASAPELAPTVAYTVRGESTRSAHTRIEFVTPGILLRRIVADPELANVGAIVVDEVHERALDTDLLLALALDARDLRGDLSILALSATLDAPKFAELLGDSTPAPVIDSPTALHPVDTRSIPFRGSRTDDRGVSRDYLDHVATVAVQALDEPGELSDSDVLVFAPGAWEVSAIAEHAAHLAPPGIEVCELHGRMEPREQDRVVRGRGPGDPRRIVVSTALAESSLTVPGVRIVVDTGLSREVRRDAARKMSGLVTVTTPRSGMAQRAGRAGRLGPGLAIRCFDDAVYAGAREHTTPEIAAADLTDAALLMSAWGTPRGSGLRLPDQPPQAAMDDAMQTLTAIGAIDADGRITERGETLSRMPIDPRLGRALLDGPELLGLQPADVAKVVAALSLDAPLPLGGRAVPGPRVSERMLARETARFEELAGAPVAAPCPSDPAHVAGLTVALAYPERIARRAEGTVYELAGGSRAGLPQGHPAAGAWIAIAQVQRSNSRDAAGTGAVIREAAPLTEVEALRCGANLIAERNIVEFTERGAKARRIKSLRAITLSSTPTKVSGAAARDAIVEGIRAGGPNIFTWSEDARQLRARLALLHRELGAPWPDMSDAALTERLPELAAPEVDALAGIGRSAPLAPSKVSMEEVLRRALPWPDAARLDELVPQALTVPSGSRIRLHYPEHPAEPVRLSVKLQEMFGLDDTPRIVDGRVRVLCELLSPARRPLALTEDLASFWDGPYVGVRAEMRGRYPKHPWPEDPRSVEATAKTNRALRRG